MSNSLITVTKPALPPLSEFNQYLERMWQSQILTNNGPMHQELEQQLCAHLGVPYICLFNNATIALLVAFKALELTGEVITTPFTFVATAETLLWNQLTPVFVDIDRDTCNINPTAIEKAITANTSAILPVHCYGNPCQVNEIKQIADSYNLKVIYDAAHAFGIEDECQSILNYGDLSVLSFHATKVFNTFEGGAIVCHSLEMKQKIDLLKNFGICGEQDITLSGLNGKMSEINAAFGLLNLAYVDSHIDERKKIHDVYLINLRDIYGIKCVHLNALKHNYGYFPILIEDDFPFSRDEVHHELLKENIMARKYFYPLLTDLSIFKMYKKSLPNAEYIASRIICLPIYPGLSENDLGRVINVVEDLMVCVD